MVLRCFARIDSLMCFQWVVLMAKGGCEAAWSTIPCLTSKQDKVNDTTPVIQSNLSACCLFSIDIGPQCCQCIQTAIMCSMFIKCSPTRTLGTMKPTVITYQNKSPKDRRAPGWPGNTQTYGILFSVIAAIKGSCCISISISALRAIIIKNWVEWNGLLRPDKQTLDRYRKGVWADIIEIPCI